MNTTNPPTSHCLLSIGPDGKLRFLWDDTLAPFLSLGQADVHRASHVEPIQTETGPQWIADLAPMNGPVLGPFPLRQEALDAENAWLWHNGLGAAR